MQAPPVIHSRRPRSYWWLLIVLPLLAAMVVLFLFNPSQYGFYPRCTLYTATGLYCPGCGSLRALHQLTHGHVLTALRCNALLILALPFLAALGARLAACWLMDRPLPSTTPNRGWIILGVTVVVLFTILRNFHWAPFNYLAPL